jgi:pyruvate formate lyase activating enzyme
VSELRIKGMLGTSFIDWSKGISSVIFLGGCNFRCPFCHNRELVINKPDGCMEQEWVLNHLNKYKKWVERVTISGGEPTVCRGLGELLGTIKKIGLSIKLDTNGSKPDTLKELISKGLLDFVAMDIKGPLNNYGKYCGVEVDKDYIEDSLNTIINCGIGYEFRTTYVPGLHSENDLYEVAEYLRKKGVKNYKIQWFQPKNTLEPSYMDIKPVSKQTAEHIKKSVGLIFKD